MAVKGDSLGHVDLRSLLELDKVLGPVVGVNVDLVTVLALEPVGVLLRGLDRLEVVLQLDPLGEALLLRVVTPEQLGFDQADSGVGEDVLLVGGLDVLVVEGLVGLGVNPADVQRAVLETPVEVLDQAGDVGQLERALD